MKGNYTKQNFADKLRQVIYEENINTKTQNEIIDALTHRGYKLGYVTKVLEGNVLFDTLSLIDVGVFASEVYKVTKTPYLNPEIYLEDAELERVDKHRVLKQEEGILEYPVVFENVIPVASDIWSLVIPVQLIAKLRNSNMLNYEYETQRESKVVETSQGVRSTPKVNGEAVRQISEKLTTNDFIPNTITLNIPLSDRGNFKYDEKSKKWVLLNGKLDIIDGYHRTLGIVDALGKKDLDYNFEIRLTHFSVDKAQRFIVQEDKRNPISKVYIQSIDNSDLITQIINQLNESDRSELKGKITTDRATISAGMSLVSFKMMYNSIKNLYKPNTINEADAIFNDLRLFYNALIDIKQDMFIHYNPTESRKEILLDEKVFVVYNILAKQMTQDENWRGRLPNMINRLEDILKDTSVEVAQEFLHTTPSTADRRFTRFFRLASEIVEVLKNE